MRGAAAAALLVAAASASDFENWNPNERDPDGKTDAQLLVERAEFVLPLDVELPNPTRPWRRSA